MKNELRIGNWVTIHRTEIEMLEGDFRFTDNFFKPISLNKEWLLKFGFEAQEESFHLKDFSIELIGDDGRWCAYIYDEYHAIECPLSLIKHVHQLQNLYFALTGEELTLKA